MVIIFELNIFKFLLANSIVIRGIISDNNNKKIKSKQLLLILTKGKNDYFSHIAAEFIHRRLGINGRGQT